MRTVLIPVDLSEATDNVLEYAGEFCADAHIDRIILLKCHYVSVYETLLPSPDFVQVTAEDVAEEMDLLQKKLDAAAHKLKKCCSQQVEVQTALSKEQLVRAVHNIIADKQPNLVMIGSDKTSYESNSRSGEQIVALAKTSSIPVMIVPSNVKYQKIETALVPCDFTAISRLSVLQGFNDRQRWLHPDLMVLNVDARKHAADEEQLAEGLKDMLKGYNYKVYFSENKDTVEGILGFARKSNVQIIIALPGKYSFFSNLTHRSITNALALNALRPVLILK
jgi:nucleotide-binding universal stress UspA family protein